MSPLHLLMNQRNLIEELPAGTLSKRQRSCIYLTASGRAGDWVEGQEALAVRRHPQFRLRRTRPACRALFRRPVEGPNKWKRAASRARLQATRPASKPREWSAKPFGSSFVVSLRIFSVEASLDGINSQALNSKWCGQLGGILEGDGATAAAPAAADSWRV
jgi:hypothetical protein